MIIGLGFIELLILSWFRKYFALEFIRFFVKITGSRDSAIWVYAVATLPGVLMHEIAHFLMAAGLGLRTGKIELLPILTESGGVEFGSVAVEKADPFRLALVGMAPLLAGLPVVAWISVNVNAPASLSTHILFGYLMVCLTIHLLPSKKDLTYWPISLLFLGILFWFWFGVINDSFLILSMVKGLIIPLITLMAGIIIFFGLNRLISPKNIVQ